MELIEAFRKAAVEGTEPVMEVINTHISNVFICKNKAYKVYKWEPISFGKFEDNNFRKDFYKQDFSWNQIMSPKIYLKLVPVAYKNNKFVNVSEEEAEDYFMEMNLIDTKCNSSELILKKKLTKKNVEDLAKIIEEKKKFLTIEKREELSKIRQDWSHLYDLRIGDLEKFSKDQSKMPPLLIKRAIEALRKIHKSSSYFKCFPSSKLIAGIDAHSDNIIIINDEISFIDIFLLEPHWRPIDPCFDICRIAVDLESLGMAELTGVLYKNSINNPYNLPKQIRLSYELSSALIKGIYNYAIGRNGLGDLYVPTIEKLIISLESL